MLWAKLLESLLVGASATALGLAIAYVWVFALGAPGLRASIAGWSVLYPEGALTPAVDFAELLAIALAVLGPFVALSIVPALARGVDRSHGVDARVSPRRSWRSARRAASLSDLVG